MPLPPLPDNSTPRLFIDYTTGRYAHSLILRVPALPVVGDALGVAFSFLDALSPLLPVTWAVTGVRTQEVGAIVTLPIDPGPLAGFEGTNLTGLDENQEPRQLVWGGRGVETGRQYRFGLYGIIAPQPATYRTSYTEGPPALQDACAALLAESAGVLCTIGGDDVRWRTYVNYNYNSYWETEVRG